MASFEKAMAYVLVNEGGHYEDPATGEISNFGISLKWLKTIDPEATAETVRSLTRDAAGDLYKQHWWDLYRVSLIPSDRVATKLFDAMINMGPVTAVRLLQETLNEPLDNPRDHIAVDGAIGPQVARAVKIDTAVKADEDALIAAFAENIAMRYEKIAADNSALQKNLPGWLARAEKLPA